MNGRRAAALAAILLAAIAVARVVSTWRIFTHTFDEPVHLSAGVEWLDRRHYSVEENPPLARIAIGLLPFLSGRQFKPVDPHVQNAEWLQGDIILYEEGDYWQTLSLARAGALPFLVLAIAVTFFWARSLYGDAAAVVAVILLTSAPPVLAHSGLATADAAAMATLAAALRTLELWIGQPSMRRATLFGLAAASAFLTKFSSIAFLGAALILLLLYVRPRLTRQHALTATAALAIVVAASAALYFFSWPALAAGVRELYLHNRKGHEAYLLGRISRTGIWYFFPVILAVKAPLGFLVAGVAGAVRAIASRIGREAFPALAAVAILAVSMTSRITIGVRHILPLFPLLAICGGGFVVALWRSRRAAARTLAAACVAWEVVVCAAAHPDYLPYFNEVAGAHPETIAVDSDLDWGQDIGRLGDFVRRHGIRQLSVALFDTEILPRHIPASLRRLPPWQPASGWIAISETMRIGVYHGGPGAYAWLDRYQPVAHAGKSIRIYFIRPSGARP